MTIEQVLQELGYTSEQAKSLSENKYFHHKKKSAEELNDLYSKVAEIYNTNSEAIKKIVLKYPQFSSYNHSRVVRQKTRLGRIAEMENKESIEKLLKHPALASYSVKRYLAAFDIARELEKEGFSQNGMMLQAFFSNYGKSPYVPGSNRKRISQVENPEQPPLMKAMRKYLTNFYEKNN